MRDWAREYFDRGYHQRWSLGPLGEDTQRDVDGLWRFRGLLTLDVGCGHGRHSIALTHRGARVIGLDSSRSLLDRARLLEKQQDASVTWVQGDMRHPPFSAKRFELAILFDAFGFFEDDAEHQAALAELARVLLPGGRVVIRVVNPELIVGHFRSSDREEQEGARVEIERTLLTKPHRLVERLSITGSRGTGRYVRRQRLYGASEHARASFPSRPSPRPLALHWTPAGPLGSS